MAARAPVGVCLPVPTVLGSSGPRGTLDPTRTVPSPEGRDPRPINAPRPLMAELIGGLKDALASPAPILAALRPNRMKLTGRGHRFV